MGSLRIKKLTRGTNNRLGKCPRCYGSLVSDCESEFEFSFKRCVLCGYHHELKTQNNTNDYSKSTSEIALEF